VSFFGIFESSFLLVLRNKVAAKLRIQPLSDLHIEVHGGYQIPATTADLIVLAGDVHNGVEGIRWAAAESQRLGKMAVYVPGNHEYYNGDIATLNEAMREEAGRLGIFFLNNDAIDVGGCRILGTTLWTDYQAWGQDVDSTMLNCKRALADHRLIAFNGRAFTPQDALLLHKESLEWLETALSVHHPEQPTVVVTHHSPSLKCSNPNFDLGPITAAFCSELDHLIGQSDVWIYGHTHACFDSTISGSRVVSNQLGYPYERTFGFDGSKTIEVSAASKVLGNGTGANHDD